MNKLAAILAVACLCIPATNAKSNFDWKCVREFRKSHPDMHALPDECRKAKAGPASTTTGESTEVKALRAQLAQSQQKVSQLQAQVANLQKGGPPQHSTGCDEDEPDHSDARHETVKLLDFDRNQLRDKIKETRHMLEEYWTDPHSNKPANDSLVQGMAILPDHPDYHKNIDYVAKKMARAFIWGDKFIIGAMGSSVTAGHDNCNYDSYERQLERLLKPVFDVAKVKFEVRNAGEGGGCGDSYKNQIWCVRNMLGDDIDVGHYSWTYFESRDVNEEHESWLRWLLMMQNSPGGVFINTGPASSEAECLMTSIKNRELADTYAKFGANGVCLQSGILKHGYPGKKWAEIGDGLHTTTRYGEHEDKVRQDSLGVTFRNWHPGPLGFQVVSDTLGYYYLAVMLRALDMIQEIAGHDVDVGHQSAHHEQLVSQFPQRQKLFDLKTLPKEKFCKPEYCSGSEPPGCKNFEYPTYGRGQVSVLPLNDPMNPFQNKYDPSKEGWKEWKFGMSDLIPREEKDRDECQHLDHCAGMQAQGRSSGWITFRLPRFNVGRIVVCATGHGKKGGQGLLDANVKFQFENTKLTVGPENIVYDKCLEVMKSFPNHMSDAKGHLHLGVFVDSEQEVKISHVMVI